MDSQEDYTTLANGEVVNVWAYGAPNDNASDFRVTALPTALHECTHYMHAAHGMIYSLSDEVLWNKYKRLANVLMQVRSDGNLGFGGGLLDPQEDVVHCLNRELKEEFGVSEGDCRFEDNDHVITAVNDKKRFVSHFYARQIPQDAFEHIEKTAIGAKDWGTETMGLTRVPLFTMEDGLRGLPVFLTNHFAGFAKEQLLETLRQRKILTEGQLDEALNGYKRCMDARLAA